MSITSMPTRAWYRPSLQHLPAARRSVQTPVRSLAIRTGRVLAWLLREIEIRRIERSMRGFDAGMLKDMGVSSCSVDRAVRSGREEGSSRL